MVKANMEYRLMQKHVVHVLAYTRDITAGTQLWLPEIPVHGRAALIYDLVCTSRTRSMVRSLERGL